LHPAITTPETRKERAPNSEWHVRDGLDQARRDELRLLLDFKKRYGRRAALQLTRLRYIVLRVQAALLVLSGACAPSPQQHGGIEGPSPPASETAPRGDQAQSPPRADCNSLTLTDDQVRSRVEKHMASRFEPLQERRRARWLVRREGCQYVYLEWSEPATPGSHILVLLDAEGRVTHVEPGR
jgi:hypothetical protein